MRRRKTSSKLFVCRRSQLERSYHRVAEQAVRYRVLVEDDSQYALVKLSLIQVLHHTRAWDILSFTL